ncbi:Ig domain-containing protein (plasmid) [Pantoea ananatis]|nr:Ig domain-containing protein [Pantoea ananatis]
MTAGGGTAPYGYTAVNLPGGLTVNGATGELSGTPAAAGSYSFQVTASDSLGASGTASFTLVVSAAAQSLRLQPGGGPLPPPQPEKCMHRPSASRAAPPHTAGSSAAPRLQACLLPTAS